VFPSGTRITLGGTGGDSDLFYTTDGSTPLGPAGEPTASALPFSGPISLDRTLRIRAQRRIGTTASTVSEALFLTPEAIAAETDLEISEIHYHPSINDAEAFVEIAHRGTNRWALIGGARLSGDIDAVVPNALTLAPGERAVFVADPAAFRARYGPSPKLLGTFAGNLSRGGGVIRLLAPSGRMVAQSAYDDTPPWPLDPDGRGPSLTLRSSVNGRDATEPGAWRPSTVTGGTPGTSDSQPFFGSPTTDADGDGWNALEEYFQGTRDTDAEDQPTLRRPSVRLGLDGSVNLSLTHPLSADQADAFWERSDDLEQWQPISISHGSGIPVFEGGLETLHWTVPASTQAQEYFRLKLRWR
jgi:hypothetical protein